MALRSSMAALIARTRRYIGDQGNQPHFADQDVQDALDEHRFTVRYALLRPGPILTLGGIYNYQDYYADVGYWEDDYLLSWGNYQTLTPTIREPIAGHWQFDLPAPGQYPPVMITGKYYDLHATAADLLEQWAAALSLTTYNFTSDGQTFHRDQIIRNLLATAACHRSQSLITDISLTRADLSVELRPLTIQIGGEESVTGF
jgi:hypothetical protein